MTDSAAAKSVRVERYDLDAAGKPCLEGWYAKDARGVVLIPPTGETALPLATQADVDRGPCRQAEARDLLNYDPAPSDAKDD